MSRLKKFTRSLVSGYMQTGVNVLYTLASVPLALHYLSPKQFALWQVAMAVSGYLLLIDFGMTDSTARILMDHKDDIRGGAYGSVIKIGASVFLIQGLFIAIAGVLISFWVPELANLSTQFQDKTELATAARDLFYLTAGQCVLQGIFFPARIFSNLAMAHQRYDFYNYAQIAGLICSFGALWVAFHQGLGIYSVLVCGGVSQVVIASCGCFFSWRAGFFPPAGCWGHFNRSLFREIFSFGGNLFLISLGGQLVNASQVLIISNTLGLETAAVWAVATKVFTLAQQLVGRILTFACSPLCEMIVRGEKDRFIQRFRDLVVVSAAAAVFVGGGVAVCNQSFLEVWLRGRDILPVVHAQWNPWNDFLLAFWLVVTTSTAIHVTAVGFVKQIGRMRYVYFCEGSLFVLAAVFLAPYLGILGIIISAIAANLVCSGVFGVRRTVKQFGVNARAAVFEWMRGPAVFLVLFWSVLFVFHLAIESVHPPIIRLLVSGFVAAAVGAAFLWRIGLSDDLRLQVRGLLSNLRLQFSGKTRSISPIKS